MQGVLRVRWRLSSPTIPRVWRHCDRCKESRPFACSGKFRTNAQKKRLDVWLVYGCTNCGQTWNCPIFERRRASEIAAPLFQALARNDDATVRLYACDVARLRRHGGRVEPAGEVQVEKDVQDGPPEGWRRLVITLSLAGPCTLRLERLLAGELGLSRVAIRALYEGGSLTVAPPGRAVLRQPVRDGQTVTLELLRLPQGRALLARAVASAGPVPARDRVPS